MLSADLPKSSWETLRLDPDWFEKIVITIEAGKIVQVEIKQTLPAYPPE